MLKLHDLMVKDLVTVEPDTPLREVAIILSERRISAVPVVRVGKVIGLVSATDVLDAVAAGATHTPEPAARLPWDEPGEEEGWTADGDEADFFSENWPGASLDELERFEEIAADHDVLDDTTAGEIMTRKLHILPADTPVVAAARYMLTEGIHRVLVEAEDGSIGLVTTTNFVQAVAEGWFER